MTDTLVDQLLEEELRNWQGTPRPFQLLDFLGVGLGSYFLWDGWGRNNLNVALGAVMIYIHAQRFLLAPPITVEAT